MQRSAANGTSPKCGAYPFQSILQGGKAQPEPTPEASHARCIRLYFYHYYMLVYYARTDRDRQNTRRAPIVLRT